MSIIQSSVRFTITFKLNTSPISLEFEDLQLGYSVPANVEGLIKITNPSGLTIYKNSGYDTDSFASPDIGSGTWTKTGITLPLNTQNNPVTGTYTFYYKVSDDSGVTVYTVTKSYDYDPTYATPTLSSSLSCDDSQVSWTDSSNYKITDYSGATITPTVTRSWALSTTATSYTTSVLAIGNLSTFTIGFNTSYNSGSILYTGEYTATLTATVSYTMEAWSGTDWFFIDDVLTDSETSDVDCDQCTCNYYECMKAISVRYDNRLENSLSQNEINYLKSTMYLLAFYYNGYLSALRCSKDTSYWCNLLQETIDKTADCCSDTTITINNPIIPITVTSFMATYGTNASIITFGTAAAGLPVAPIDSQVHIFTTTAGSYSAYDVYYWNGVSWVDQGNLKGASGTSEVAVLENDISDDADASGVGAQTLKTYTLPGGTLANDGSYLEVDAYLDIKASINATLYINFGGTAILTQAVNTAVQTQIHLRSTINRTGATAQTIISIAEFVGSPNSALEKAITTTSKTLANANDIDIITQKAVAGGIGDITCKYLKVTKFTKS